MIGHRRGRHVVVPHRLRLQKQCKSPTFLRPVGPLRDLLMIDRI
jgi:hypothetical protein